MIPDAQQIIVDLHGARARRGVDIDALENFIEYFRRALRDFDRERRGDMVGRGGHPDARDAAATAFRLVAFQVGSGIATLEPGDTSTQPESDSELAPVERRSALVLAAMLDALDGGEEVSPAVLDALTSATRAIGDDGSFGVRIGDRRVVVDASRIDAIRARASAAEDARDVVVTGRLHMIEVDDPGRRVSVKTPENVDWTCTYPEALEPIVLHAVKRIVRVEGTGRKITPLTGRMDMVRVELLPEYAQEELFTTAPLAVEVLRDRQGVSSPQGLAALSDPDWEDDEESRRFLEATLGDVA